MPITRRPAGPPAPTAADLEAEGAGDAADEPAATEESESGDEESSDSESE